MSIVTLSEDFLKKSDITVDDVYRLAGDIGFSIAKPQDAEDYLVLLRSFEAVMNTVQSGPDYAHPSLEPQPCTDPREYWTPTAEQNPFNGWIHRCELKSASPKNALLNGRSIAIKDNIAIGGLPTTLGTSPKILRRDDILPPSSIDATIVSRILSAGGIVKGSSTCESFCASPLAFTSANGPVQNPILHGFTTGGSSSGSAALVKAEALSRLQDNSDRGSFGVTAEIGVGSDQAGSIRIPASYTGLYGLKPTFGLVPYTGAGSMTAMIDHLGPMAWNIEDIALMLKVMAGYDGLDPRMTPESPLLDQVKDYPQILRAAQHRFSTTGIAEVQDGKKLRVGLLTESFEVAGVSQEVRQVVRDAARTFFSAAGVEVVDVSVPMHKQGPIIWTAATRPSMSDWLCQGRSTGHLTYLPSHMGMQWPPTQDVYERLTELNPAVVNIMLSKALADREFGPGVEVKAQRKVYELRAAYDAAFEQAGVDVLVTPCAPTTAMPHPKLKNNDGNSSTIMEKLGSIVGVTNNTCPFNLTGHPAMNVPCGSAAAPGHPDVQLPIGMQIIGRRWRDENLIIAAAVFEEGQKRMEN
ncbi:putative amidase [Xylariaceae sp. FL1272]|nr:putative amidase [Xylariaceae sp. FL1272]